MKVKTMKHFKEIKTLQELRNEYKRLSFLNHPDVSGFDSTAIMQEINSEYDSLTKKLAKETLHYESEMSFASLYKEKINILIKIKGISIEIIGNWLWVSGDTKPVKDTLKSMHFMYAPKKQAWYFKTYKYSKKSSTSLSIDEIRNLYGSQKLKSEDESDERLNKLVIA